MNRTAKKLECTHSHVVDGEYQSGHTSELATAGIGSVEMCTCGMVTLNIGPITVRLTLGALEELHQLLTQSVIQSAIIHNRNDCGGVSVEHGAAQA